MLGECSQRPDSAKTKDNTLIITRRVSCQNPTHVQVGGECVSGSVSCSRSLALPPAVLLLRLVGTLRGWRGASLDSTLPPRVAPPTLPLLTTSGTGTIAPLPSTSPPSPSEHTHMTHILPSCHLVATIAAPTSWVLLCPLSGHTTTATLLRPAPLFFPSRRCPLARAAHAHVDKGLLILTTTQLSVLRTHHAHPFLSSSSHSTGTFWMLKASGLTRWRRRTHLGSRPFLLTQHGSPLTTNTPGTV
jgi:hypothetical protein